MKNRDYYNSSFYRGQKDYSYLSSKIIVPSVIELLKPKSVLDVGCGLGTWLKAFEENGIENIFGVDGDYVNIKELYIQATNFKSVDISQEFSLDRKFDLVVSLEVGEHIREDQSDIFIKNLVGHGDVVLFSAAIPYQGGTNHINEQWQSFWAQKFRVHDFVPIDYLRRKFWDYDTAQVQIHYVQNSLIYVKNTVLDEINNNLKDFIISDDKMISVVHPETFIGKVDPDIQSVQLQWRFFLKVLKRRLQRRLGEK